MTPVTVLRGDGPIILGQPHSGTFVPPHISAQLNSFGRELRDTDWHIPALYEGLLDGATVVRANFSRYVIDANRDPEGRSLYPGRNTTELVPTRTFDDQPIWTAAPSKADIAERLATYHSAYHEALSKEITRVKTRYGLAVLYDCHSIRSRIPYLFDDQLPDLNIGNNHGVTCDSAFTDAIVEACSETGEFSHILNGRFLGGWTTRHYGRPETGVHAIQMEIAQRTYLETETPPFAYAPEKAAPLRAVLRAALNAIHDIAILKSEREM